MIMCLDQGQHQKAGVVGLGFVASAAAEMRRGSDCGGAVVSMRCSDGVVCPKPRRIGVSHNRDYPFRPSPLLHTKNQQMEACDAKAGDELLDIIFSRGHGNGAEKLNSQVASSPPFFSGSPPSRASNPLIQDEQFGNNTRLSPLTRVYEPLALPSSPSRKMVGGCVPAKYGHSPAPVRIEGFNCHNNRCGISVIA